MTKFAAFVGAGVGQAVRGGWRYWCWLGALAVVAGVGVDAYRRQLERGLVVTGMSDQVSWGVYIANFTFLEAVAAATVLLVVPAYVFRREELRPMVLLSQGLAVAAVVASMLFVTVDLGRPDRIWHMLPGLGRLNFPASLMAWDVVMLGIYLFVTATLPVYMLYRKYHGLEPDPRTYGPGIAVAVAWSILILTATAFLFSSNVGRPFWNSAVLGPRFVTAAFTGGTALLILALQAIDRVSALRVPLERLEQPALVLAVALQANLFLQGAELFTDFYGHAEHSISARYLYVGLDGLRTLVPWIWSAITMSVIAVLILMIHPLRRRRLLLNAACLLAVVAVWIEKTMGLVVPGFVPTPLGEVFEYSPTRGEVFVSLGIWAVGALIFTVLAKVAIPIETGALRDRAARPPADR